MFPFKTNTDRKKQQPVHPGATLVAFDAPEMLDYARGPVWYLVAGAASLFVVTIGILTQAITLVIAYLLAASVYFLLHHRAGRLIRVTLAEHGITVGEDYFSYTELAEWWIVWRPPHIADLRFVRRNRLAPVTIVHLPPEVDAEAIRTALAGRVPEMPDRDASLTDIISHLLRL